MDGDKQAGPAGRAKRDRGRDMPGVDVTHMGVRELTFRGGQDGALSAVPAHRVTLGELGLWIKRQEPEAASRGLPAPGAPPQDLRRRLDAVDPGGAPGAVATYCADGSAVTHVPWMRTEPADGAQHGSENALHVDGVVSARDVLVMSGAGPEAAPVRLGAHLTGVAGALDGFAGRLSEVSDRIDALAAGSARWTASDDALHRELADVRRRLAVIGGAVERLAATRCMTVREEDEAGRPIDTRDPEKWHFVSRRATDDDGARRLTLRFGDMDTVTFGPCYDDDDNDGGEARGDCDRPSDPTDGDSGGSSAQAGPCAETTLDVEADVEKEPKENAKTLPSAHATGEPDRTRADASALATAKTIGPTHDDGSPTDDDAREPDIDHDGGEGAPPEGSVDNAPTASEASATGTTTTTVTRADSDGEARTARSADAAKITAAPSQPSGTAPPGVARDEPESDDGEHDDKRTIPREDSTSVASQPEPSPRTASAAAGHPPESAPSAHATLIRDSSGGDDRSNPAPTANGIAKRSKTAAPPPAHKDAPVANGADPPQHRLGALRSAPKDQYQRRPPTVSRTVRAPQVHPAAGGEAAPRPKGDRTLSSSRRATHAKE